MVARPARSRSARPSSRNWARLRGATVRYLNPMSSDNIGVQLQAQLHTDGVAVTEPRVLGWDAVGIVDAVGDEVTLFQPGDAVFYAGAIGRPGSNAEYQLVDERIVGHKPASLDDAAAAEPPAVAIATDEDTGNKASP